MIRIAPMLKFALPAAAALGLVALTYSGAASAEHAVHAPAPKLDITKASGPQVAVFAGGCFWGMEAVFEQVKGVRSVTTGYAGGSKGDATYDRVSTESTGHAEAVRIVYDPARVSYGTLLRVYFSITTDPTQLNRQTPDTGPSYRTAIFPQNADQRVVADAYIKQLGAAHVYPAPIVTRLETGGFFPAEDYHQDFYRKNPDHPYIVRWDKPKMAAFRAMYPQLAK
jgi:peptide-methionine (S)-S-oxide reductase